MDANLGVRDYFTTADASGERNHDLSSVKVSSGWASRWRAMPEKKSSSCAGALFRQVRRGRADELEHDAAARLSVCK